jgi:uncharacterized protein
MKVAVVTGASSGLGAEFARQIEAGLDTDEIWLVARREEPMQALAAGFSRARGVCMALDLGSAQGRAALVSRLAERDADVRLLVNSAGFGMHGRFETLDLDRQLAMIDLNVRALTEITRGCLARMREGSAIINVASVIGLAPAAGWAVYAATKAYVVSFSCALAAELGPRGIRCTACCPGPMKTGFFDLAGEGSDGLPFHVDPSRVAKLALRHARKGKPVSVQGFWMRLAALLFKLSPRGAVARASARGLRR